MTISQETYAETLARAMANPVHSKGCGCKRCVIGRYVAEAMPDFERWKNEVESRP